MSFFNELSETVNSMLQELQDARERYAEYRSVDIYKLEGFHEPDNESQKQIAKKAAKSGMPIIIIVGVVFVLAGIYGFLQGESSGKAFFIAFAVLGLIIVGFALFTGFSKVEVMEGGKAAFKQMRSSGSGKSRSTKYYVAVYFDHPEKIIVPNMQTTRAEYFDIVEGTPILIVKKGILFFARIDK